MKNTTQTYTTTIDRNIAVISRSLFFQYIPKLAKKSLEINKLIEDEMSKLKILIGDKEAKELIAKFKNEAISNPNVVNSDYVLDNLQKAFRSYQYGL